MQFDARVDAFVPRIESIPDFFWRGGRKEEKKSKRFRESTGSGSNGRPLSMMSTKVSTACNGFLIAKQLHGTRFSFVQLLVFDAYRYGLLTLSMGNARFFFFFSSFLCASVFHV